MGCVVEPAAFHCNVGGLFQQGHESIRSSLHPRLIKAVSLKGHRQKLKRVACRADLGKDVGRRGWPLKETGGKTAVRLLKATGGFNRLLNTGFGFGPPTSEICRVETRCGKVAIDRHGKAVESMRAAAGALGQVGCRFHRHEFLERPLGSVASGPGGIRWHVGGECHQCPGGLLARSQVVLRLVEKVRDAVRCPARGEFCVERHPFERTLGEIAEPLVGMPLAGLAARIEDGEDAIRSRPQCPADELATGEQILQGRRGCAVVLNGEIVTKREDAVHNLPGGMVGGVEPPAVSGVGEHRIDAVTETGRVDRRRFRESRRRGSRLRLAAQAAQHGRKREIQQKRPKRTRRKGRKSANHSGARCVEVG